MLLSCIHQLCRGQCRTVRLGSGRHCSQHAGSNVASPALRLLAHRLAYHTRSGTWNLSTATTQLSTAQKQVLPAKRNIVKLRMAVKAGHMLSVNGRRTCCRPVDEGSCCMQHAFDSCRHAAAVTPLAATGQCISQTATRAETLSSTCSCKRCQSQSQRLLCALVSNRAHCGQGLLLQVLAPRLPKAPETVFLCARFSERLDAFTVDYPCRLGEFSAAATRILQC